MIVAPRFNVSVGHQEYGQDDNHDVPTGEDEANNSRSDL